MENCKNCEHGCHCSNGGSCTSCECKDCDCKESDKKYVNFEPDFDITVH